MISREFLGFAARFYLGKEPGLLPKVRELQDRQERWSPGAGPTNIKSLFDAANNLEAIRQDVSRLESWGGLRAFPALRRIHKGVYPYRDLGHR